MDPFATLGLPRRYDLDEAELDRRYRDLQQALHPDKHGAAPASERAMILRKAMEVNEAYRVLRDDAARAQALLAAHGCGGSEARAEAADPALLMEMMEMREALSDAREASQAERVAALAAEVADKRAGVTQALAAEFRKLAADPGAPDAVSSVQALLGRLRYYRRFLDEVALFEDEAHA